MSRMFRRFLPSQSWTFGVGSASAPRRRLAGAGRRGSDEAAGRRREALGSSETCGSSSSKLRTKESSCAARASRSAISVSSPAFSVMSSMVSRAMRTGCAIGHVAGHQHDDERHEAGRGEQARAGRADARGRGPGARRRASRSAGRRRSTTRTTKHPLQHGRVDARLVRISSAVRAERPARRPARCPGWAARPRASGTQPPSQVGMTEAGEEEGEECRREGAAPRTHGYVGGGHRAAS